jgi:acetyl-CoA carboxylase carboxyltransferase component
MGGTQAAKVLAQIEASSLKKSGEVDEAKEALFSLRSKPVMTNRFHLITLLSPLTDAIIDPLDTRTLISMGIEGQPPIENNSI